MTRGDRSAPGAFVFAFTGTDASLRALIDVEPIINLREGPDEARSYAEVGP